MEPGDIPVHNSQSDFELISVCESSHLSCCAVLHGQLQSIRGAVLAEARRQPTVFVTMNTGAARASGLRVLLLAAALCLCLCLCVCVCNAHRYNYHGTGDAPLSRPTLSASLSLSFLLLCSLFSFVLSSIVLLRRQRGTTAYSGAWCFERVPVRPRQV